MWTFLAPIITALLILFLTAFFTPFRRYLFGPTLRIIALKTDDVEKGHYWKVFVTSTGIFSSEQAKNCSAKVTIFPILESDVISENAKLKSVNFRNNKFIFSESICWSKEGYPETININPSDSESIELMFFNINDRKIIIPSEKGWGDKGGLDLIHLKPGNYTFRIVVTSENGHAGWAHFEFRKPENDENEEGPWATFCIHRNNLWPFRIPLLPTDVFDLRLAGIK